MPTYELMLIAKVMSRVKLIETVKRSAEVIYDRGGFIRKIESLGTLDLAEKIRRRTKASYFLMHFDSPEEKIYEMYGRIYHDTDLMRIKIFEMPPVKPLEECTLQEESRPPSFRSEVHKMIEEAYERRPKNIRNRLQRHTENNEYPFSL